MAGRLARGCLQRPGKGASSQPAARAWRGSGLPLPRRGRPRSGARGSSQSGPLRAFCSPAPPGDGEGGRKGRPAAAATSGHEATDGSHRTLLLPIAAAAAPSPPSGRGAAAAERASEPAGRPPGERDPGPGRGTAASRSPSRKNPRAAGSQRPLPWWRPMQVLLRPPAASLLGLSPSTLRRESDLPLWLAAGCAQAEVRRAGERAGWLAASERSGSFCALRPKML